MSIRMPNFRKKPGYAMVLALIFMVVFLILGSALFSQTTNFLRFSTNSTLNEQATNLAEAGIEHAIWQLNATAGSFNPHPDDVFAVGSTGKFKISVITKTSTTKTITATGYIPDDIAPKAKRSIKVISKFGPGIGEQIGFSYATHADTTIFMANTGIINGNAYSNGNITSLGGSGARINGDAYGRFSVDPLITVTGTRTTGGYQPLPTVNYAPYQAAADASVENCTGTKVINSSTTIGFKKYTCNLEIAGGSSVVVKVAGPIHVTGTFRMTESATLQADDSLGTNGTLFIVDGWTYLSANSKVLPTSANPPNIGYLLFIQPGNTPVSGSTCNCVFDIYSQDAKAIFYTRYGSISLNNSSRITSATANIIVIGYGTSVIFDTGLPLETFTSGGSTWQFTKGTYLAVAPPPEPVRFGWTGVGNTAVGVFNRMVLSRLYPVQASQQGQVCSGRAYIKGNANDATVYMAVYKDSGGLTPGTLLAVSNGVVVPSTQAAGWINFIFPSMFTVGTTLFDVDIWIGIYADGAGTESSANGPQIHASTSTKGNYYPSVDFRYYNWGNIPLPSSGSGTSAWTHRSWSEYLNVKPSCTT